MTSQLHSDDRDSTSPTADQSWHEAVIEALRKVPWNQSRTAAELVADDKAVFAAFNAYDLTSHVSGALSELYFRGIVTRIKRDDHPDYDAHGNAYYGLGRYEHTDEGDDGSVINRATSAAPAAAARTDELQKRVERLESELGVQPETQ